MIAPRALSLEAAKAPSLLFAVVALDFLAALDALAQIAEFVPLIQEYLRGPQSAEFMDVCSSRASCHLNFDRAIDRTALDSQFLVQARPSAKDADFIVSSQWVYLIVRSLLKHLKVVSHNLAITIELNYIFSLSFSL